MNHAPLEISSESILALPSSAQVQSIVSRTHGMFARTLSHWAMDVLAIRRRGCDRAIWQPSDFMHTPSAALQSGVARRRKAA